jgi:hypothetical protein
MTEIDKCYMCDNLASSKEHVPPKCIFPERKDVTDQDFRENLITVPSCDDHNSKKSKDDEFLLVMIAGIIGNNSIGYGHKFTKVDRAIRRSSGRLIEKAFLRKEKYLIEIDNNKFLEIIWGTPDQERLQKCFEHIAYGIYYHHFSKRFRGQIRISLGYLHHSEKNPDTFAKLIKHKAEIELRDSEVFGKNKDVFFYQFTEKDQYGIFMLKLCFYGGIDVYISFAPKNFQNFRLDIEMMNRGIKTFVKVEDKLYEFN